MFHNTSYPHSSVRSLGGSSSFIYIIFVPRDNAAACPPRSVRFAPFRFFGQLPKRLLDLGWTRLLDTGNSLGSIQTARDHRPTAVRASRSILGLSVEILVANTAHLSSPSTPPIFFPFLRRAFANLEASSARSWARDSRQIGGTSAVGRLSGFERYPSRKLAGFRADRVLINLGLSAGIRARESFSEGEHPSHSRGTG